MSVDKIILRAFLTTFASILILFLFMITALVCVYPQTMMELTYDLGMETSSIWFAEVSYDRSDDIYYIAYATEVAIGQHDYDKVDACGEQLIKDEGFSAYCAEKNKNVPDGATITYEQYIYGQVCIAKYKRHRVDKTKAVNRAFELTGQAFPRNNAVVAVLLTALGKGDEATVQTIKGKMEELQNELGGEERAYLAEVLALLGSE